MSNDINNKEKISELKLTMINRKLPFVDPSVDEKEVEAVVKVLRSKKLVEGENTRSFEKKFAEFTGVKHAIACNNGTAALHLAMESSPLKPGDEVITTPFTFIATSNSILFTGAVPKFVDIDPNTWNIDPEKIKEAITPKTKAIMPVHIFGLPVNMPVINEIAEEHELFVIEDAAQAHGARINGQHVGGFGQVATFSLYATKNLISGEGGVITTNNDELADIIKSLKNHGRTPSGGYQHTRVGYNFRLPDYAGAIAGVQMDKLSGLLKQRSTTASYYRKILDEIEQIDYQHVPSGFDHGNYIFALNTSNHDLVPKEIIERLGSKNILARPIYSILSYQQQNFIDIQSWRWAQFVDYPDYSSISCPIAEQIATNHLEIPVVPSLTDNEREYIGKILIEVFK